MIDTDTVLTLYRTPDGVLQARLANLTTACTCGGVLHQVAGVWQHLNPATCPAPQVEQCRCPHSRTCTDPVALTEPCAFATPACCGGCWDRAVEP